MISSPQPPLRSPAERPAAEDWSRLEALLGRLEKNGPRGLTAAELDELVLLYRISAADLADLEARASDLEAIEPLHRLVARAYLRLHGRRIGRGQSWTQFWRSGIPQAFRASTGPIAFAVLVFVSALILGTIGGLADESLAGSLLGDDALETLRNGELWTRDLLQIAPESALAARILTNNIALALLAFVGGLTLGLGTLAIVLVNGFQLGVLLPLVARYGSSAEFTDFIVAHGFLELTMTLVAAGAGFRVAEALIVPGVWPRGVALRRAARDGARLLVFTAVGLVVAGILEGYVSPRSELGFGIKLAVGLSVWGAALTYALLAGRRHDSPTAPRKIEARATTSRVRRTRRSRT